MRKISLALALVASLFTLPAYADFTGKDASAATITFKNPATCSSVVCVPVFQIYDGTNVVTLTTAGADAVSNTLTGVPTYARMQQFNGTTWDRWQGAVSIASGKVASGAFASGSIASGAVASGAVAAGAIAAGAGVDGWDLTQGAKADAKNAATDTTPITAMSVWKQISASIQAAASSLATAVTSLATIATNTGAAIPAGTAHIGTVGTAPYPDGAVAYTATATGTTGATTATLAGAAAVTTYICGFSIRANAAAAATGNATVTGVITATLNFTQWTAPNASGLGVTEEIFSPCIPASGTNQSIAVISAAPGTSGVVSVTAWGYKL